MSRRRVLFGILFGAILGVFCIIGAQTRTEEVLSNTYLLGFWYNRLLMGIIIGLLPVMHPKYLFLRGLTVGIFVSFAFFVATNYFDILGFLVGGLYGIIIEYGLFYIDRSTK